MTMTPKQGEEKMETGNTAVDAQSAFKHIIKIVNSPWCMEPNKLTSLMEVFDFKLNGGSFASTPKKESWEIYRVNSTITEVVLDGMFVPTTMGASPVCGMIPTFALIDVLETIETETVILSLDTPGGVLTGIPELADYIKNSDKEFVVYSREMLCSAGYWIASAADKVFIGQSCTVGSIGVRTTITKNTEVEGSKKTYIFSAGGAKAFGDPDLPITEEEKTAMQSSVDHVYTWFTNTVSKYRNVELDRVTSTDAKTFKGVELKDSEEEWLVDGVISQNEFKNLILN